MGRTLSFYDLRDALTQPGCAVCRLKAISAERFLDTLLWENVNDPGMRYDIRRALARVQDEAVFEALVQTQRAIWERLVGHLSEIIRKSDYHFQDEPRGEEVGGALRAIAALSGPCINKGSS